MGDGMEDAHREYKRANQVELSIKMGKVERCVDDLKKAREALRAAEEGLAEYRRDVSRLAKELEGYIK